MLILADTNVLMRLLDRNNPHHGVIRGAVRKIAARQDRIVLAPQTIAELWNVSTRPATARGGFGLSLTETDRRVRVLERAFAVLPEQPDLYPRWRALVLKHQVQGVNVHDARLVAFMQVHHIDHLLTMNVQDFVRYTGITVVAPSTV